LLQALGYTYVPPEVLEAERESLKEVVLTKRLGGALKRLNRWLSDDNTRQGRADGDHDPGDQPSRGQREAPTPS
jgi:type I site-specific restriction-modification system R (restriction) subunit